MVKVQVALKPRLKQTDCSTDLFLKSSVTAVAAAKKLFFLIATASARCYSAELFWELNGLTNAAYLYLETNLFQSTVTTFATYIVSKTVYTCHDFGSVTFAEGSVFGVE